MSRNLALGLALRGNWEAGGSIPTPVIDSPALSVSDDKTGTSVTLTLTASAHADYDISYIFRRDINNNYEFVTSLESGEYQDTGLTEFTMYWYMAIPVNTDGYMGNPSSVASVTPMSGYVGTPMGAGEDMTNFLMSMLRDDQWPTWYRIRSGYEPPGPIDSPQTSSASEHYFLRVADSPTHWENLGQIPMLVQQVMDLNIVERQFCEKFNANAMGLVSYDYAIAPGDHFVDYNDNEYRCTGVTTSASKVARMVALVSLVPIATMQPA